MTATHRLGDFTVTRRVVPIAALAVLAGMVCALVARALLGLIGLFTNLAWYHRWSTELVSPGPAAHGALALLVPVAGALVIGFMARYGSEKIRGHGIPEAIEAILINGSRVEPKVAFLKPLSAAVSIGTGGPFGAEGPIIMTGGAVGSLIAQSFHLTAAERKTLLVAGAAGGMSATFDTPIAAALLAVELLLFEWKPRSFIPVALASATAAWLRRPLLGAGPLFHLPVHGDWTGAILLAAVGVGLLAGGVSVLLTKSVYASEDLFAKLPIHWMWWPALGGLVIGIGGLLDPAALGVGYDVIAELLGGVRTGPAAAKLGAVKWAIWSISLGSGTSGGVLAPLLMLGGVLGAVAGPWLPAAGAGVWPLVAMGGMLGGTMRVPFTAVVFALELTHDQGLLLPLFLAVTAAYAVTTVGLRRSILTERIERRGFHLTREYAVDPLEILFAREVMRPEHGGRAAPGPVAVAGETLRTVALTMSGAGVTRLPVVDHAGSRKLRGFITLRDLLAARRRHLEEEVRRERVIKWERLLPGSRPAD